MSKTRSITIFSMIGITVILTFGLLLTSAKAEAGHDHSGKMDMKKHMKAKPLSLEKIHSGHLPMVSQSIDKAIKAVKAGNNETALSELLKAQKMLAAIKDGIGKHIKPQFANARCPIMNSPINSDKVTKNLIRDYKGQKVAFCCAGCPAAWDKLTDAQKRAKLAKVRPVPSQLHIGQNH